MNPLDAQVDADSDAGVEDAGDDSSTPTGIQATTTPDNFGCQMTSHTNASSSLLMVLAIGLLIVRLRRAR